MTYKYKNNVAKLKNQNNSLIQDGDEIISRHFDFLAWQHCFYFDVSLELQDIMIK
jgi:hypothetical protein